MHSVIGHTAWLMQYVSLCLQSDGETRPPRSSVGEPPVGADVLPWFGESRSIFSKSLDEADFETLRPTFTGPQPASWYLRRLANELAMHRWDVQAAISSPDSIEADLARDGIDEVLEIFVPNRLDFDTLNGVGETIHFHSTDAEDGEWLLRLQADRVDWELGHAKGDVAARGTMSDLLLLIWGRIPPARVEVFGDAALLDRWQKAAAF